jgi:SEL1 protein
VAVAFYKIVAERGDWTHEVWWEAERAWHRGDKDTALLGYWMMAERGYEVAQNNIAWIFDRGASWLNVLHWSSLRPQRTEKQKMRIPLLDKNASTIPTDRLALTFWTRSAAQDNVDALVKMGDYYLKGVGVAAGRPQPEKAAACYQSAASTHVSALAMHNLGWMHENGIGVTKVRAAIAVQDADIHAPRTGLPPRQTLLRPRL